MQSFKIIAFLLHDYLWLYTKQKQQQDNLANLEASLAPAEAEFGALAKADQHANYNLTSFVLFLVIGRRRRLRSC